MTSDEELLCTRLNRDLFEAHYIRNEITFAEAAFIARRDQFLLACIRFGIPRVLLLLAGRTYDLLFEHAALNGRSSQRATNC